MNTLKNMKLNSQLSSLSTEWIVWIAEFSKCLMIIALFISIEISLIYPSQNCITFNPACLKRSQLFESS